MWRKEKENEMEKSIKEEKKEVEEVATPRLVQGQSKELRKGDSKGKIKERKDKVKGFLKKKKGTVGRGKKKREEVVVTEEKKERMDSIRKVMGNLLVFYSTDNDEDQSSALKERFFFCLHFIYPF